MLGTKVTVPFARDFMPEQALGGMPLGLRMVTKTSFMFYQSGHACSEWHNILCISTIYHTVHTFMY